ncbi:MAG: DUF3662 domain-containing protein [Chloroflexi bacterium]|nr:DUF3662 domain-containing protein [Chloroflexota bacterium]
MTVLGRLERLLTILVEGTVERWFKPRVQPVHLARRLEAALEDGVLVGPHGPLAPNAFVVTVDPATYARFAGARTGIQRELEQHLVTAAARRRLRTLDPFRVELQADPALEEGRCVARAAFQERSAGRNGVAGLPEGSRPEQTVMMPVGIEETVAVAPAALEVLGPGEMVRTVPLTGAACTLGRADDNTLVLPESAVSRHHAAIRRTGDGFVVEDMGSTNGVVLNGKRVQRAHLKDGDRLLIGTVELVFRQR